MTEKTEDTCYLCSWVEKKPVKIIGQKYKLIGNDLAKILLGNSKIGTFRGESHVCKEHAIGVCEIKINLINAEIEDAARKLGDLYLEKGKIEKNLEELKK